MMTNKNKLIVLGTLGVCALAGLALVGLYSPGPSFEDSFLQLKSNDSDARSAFEQFIVKY